MGRQRIDRLGKLISLEALRPPLARDAVHGAVGTLRLAFVGPPPGAREERGGYEALEVGQQGGSRGVGVIVDDQADLIPAAGAAVADTALAAGVGAGRGRVVAAMKRTIRGAGGGVGGNEHRGVVIFHDCPHAATGKQRGVRQRRVARGGRGARVLIATADAELRASAAVE